MPLTQTVYMAQKLQGRKFASAANKLLKSQTYSSDEDIETLKLTPFNSRLVIQKMRSKLRSKTN